MGVYFCVLGSGSSGNAALLKTPSARVLIDAGFSPQELERRMTGTGASWESLDAVILTHLHRDHFKRTCFRFCAKNDVEFYCHERHAEKLDGIGSFKQLRRAGLVRTYGSEAFDVAGTLRVRPVEIPHDSPPTFGFLIETLTSDGRTARLGYFADLGECEESIARTMAGVDLLALEFNHDERMQLDSGRHPSLIERVMGREGHLSNRQAAEVFRIVLQSGHPPPKALVQIHISRECNRAELAFQSAQVVATHHGAATRIFSSRQEIRGTIHRVD